MLYAPSRAQPRRAGRVADRAQGQGAAVRHGDRAGARAPARPRPATAAALAQAAACGARRAGGGARRPHRGGCQSAVCMARRSRAREAAAGAAPPAVRRGDPRRALAAPVRQCVGARPGRRTRTAAAAIALGARVAVAGGRTGLRSPACDARRRSRRGGTGAVARSAAAPRARRLDARATAARAAHRIAAGRAALPRRRRWNSTGRRETARHVGTVVHRELQRIGRDAVLPDPADAALRRRWQDELAELGVPQDRRTRGRGARGAVPCRRTLQHERGRWLLDASGTAIPRPSWRSPDASAARSCAS